MSTPNEEEQVLDPSIILDENPALNKTDKYKLDEKPKARGSEGMNELEALHWLIEMRASIDYCQGVTANTFTGGHTKRDGVLVTIGAGQVWAPSILDAAIVLKGEQDARGALPKLGG